ncbi:MAG: hypothetical protein AAFY26_06020 [Cyanobacteria bacterium J06638_22]
MLIDRIVLDSWNWLRRLFWFRFNRVEEAPTEILETHRGRYGIVRRVTRDTARAVATWVYTPFRTKTQIDAGVPVRDLHLMIDHLEVVAGDRQLSYQTRRARGVNTHRIYVILCDRSPQPNDSFEGETLFSAEYMLHLPEGGRDLYALIAGKKLAELMLTRNPLKMQWDKELELLLKQILGAHWQGTISTAYRQPITVTGVILDDPGAEEIAEDPIAEDLFAAMTVVQKRRGKPSNSKQRKR